jgi:hypothetical protein
MSVQSSIFTVCGLIFTMLPRHFATEADNHVYEDPKFPRSQRKEMQAPQE